MADGTTRIRFPGLSPAEAASVARELELALVADGAPRQDLRVARDDAEAMDFGGTLVVGAGILGWEFLKEFTKGFAKGAGSEIGKSAGRDVYDALRRKIDEFCRNRCVAAEVTVPDGRTFVLRSEYDRSDEDAAVLPGDLGTLGIVVLGASTFPGLEGLDNPAFARSAAAAKEVFAAAGPLFRRVAVLDLFDQDVSPNAIIDAIERHIETLPDMADLLVYYCGHGDFLRDQTYFLTLRGTRKGREANTGLTLRGLRHDLEAQLSRRRLYLVLDCCYAGAAVKEWMGPNVGRAVADALHDALPPGGWVVLAAAAASVRAMAPAGEELTMFTGALAQVLRGAVRPLSFDDIAFETRRIIQSTHSNRSVAPECHAPRQRGGDLRRVRLFGGQINGPSVAALGQAEDANELIRLRQQAEAGNPELQRNIADIYYYGLGVERSYEHAFRLYTLASDQGDWRAQFKLANMYEDGEGVERSYEDAVRFYSLAADQGHPEPLLKLGEMYEHGKGAEQSYEEAARLYRRASDQADSTAQCKLGTMYEEGKGVKQNYEQAVTFYRLAVEQGNYQAIMKLGKMYETGRGVKQSYQDAAQLYRTAARRTWATEAQLKLGEMHEKGLGVEQSGETAIWFYKLASGGHDGGRGYLKIGKMHEDGRGVEESQEKAAESYAFAAEKGNVDTYFKLGSMYEEGRGVELNYMKAQSYYLRAAWQGSVEAMLKLAKMYQIGRGVKKDHKKAKEYYARAAFTGNAEARFIFDEMQWQPLRKLRCYYEMIRRILT